MWIVRLLTLFLFHRKDLVDGRTEVRCFPMKQKPSRRDATGVQGYLQAVACAHQRTKSAKHTLFFHRKDLVDGRAEVRCFPMKQKPFRRDATRVFSMALASCLLLGEVLRRMEEKFMLCE